MAVDAADLAVVAVDGQLGFEAIDEIEPIFRGFKRRQRAEGQGDLKLRRHRPPAEVRIARLLLALIKLGRGIVAGSQNLPGRLC